MLSSSGNTVASSIAGGAIIPANSSSAGGPLTLQNQQIQQQNTSSAGTSSATVGGITPVINSENFNSAKTQKTFSNTQVVDMKILTEIDQDVDPAMAVQHQQRAAPIRDPSDEDYDYDIDRKLKKPVSNSNSTPDFKSQLQQIAAKNAQQKQRFKDNKNVRLGVANNHQSEIESARLNFVKANIPLTTH